MPTSTSIWEGTDSFSNIAVGCARKREKSKKKKIKEKEKRERRANIGNFKNRNILVSDYDSSIIYTTHV